MSTENRIDYVEIPVTDLKKTRAFFEALFGWTFQDWGDEYISFSDGRLNGGFRLATEATPPGGVLLAGELGVTKQAVSNRIRRGNEKVLRPLLLASAIEE